MGKPGAEWAVGWCNTAYHYVTMYPCDSVCPCLFSPWASEQLQLGSRYWSFGVMGNLRWKGSVLVFSLFNWLCEILAFHRLFCPEVPRKDFETHFNCLSCLTSVMTLCRCGSSSQIWFFTCFVLIAQVYKRFAHFGSRVSWPSKLPQLWSAFFVPWQENTHTKTSFTKGIYPARALRHFVSSSEEWSTLLGLRCNTPLSQNRLQRVAFQAQLTSLDTWNPLSLCFNWRTVRCWWAWALWCHRSRSDEITQLLSSIFLHPQRWLFFSHGKQSRSRNMPQKQAETIAFRTVRIL